MSSSRPAPPRSTPEERLTHWEGEPVRVWESLWALPVLEAWTRVGSTNDRARELAAVGALPFTVVLADEQTAGRGRAGRRWDSPSGAGLWMSVVLTAPSAAARRLAPLLVGLAACRAVERSAEGVRAGLKWPNDVLLGERKVAGILCEGVGGAPVLVAGVGINVRQRLADFPPGLRESAVSLEMASGRSVSRTRLAGALLGELRALLERPPLRLEGEVASEIARRDVIAGRAVELDRGVRGRALGIDPEGRLRVEGEDGKLFTVMAGGVTLTRGAARGAAREP